jgi:hypothetical protein
LTRPIVFSEAAQAKLAGQRVAVAAAVKMELASETPFLWLGNGKIRTNDGQEWEGLGRLGGLDGLEFGAIAPTQQITMKLSGLDSSLAADARDQYAQMRGRRVSVYALVGDESSGKPLDLPYLVMLATIDRATLQRSGDAWVLEVTAEPLFASKHVPALNLVTNSDQANRYPGDKIFERTSYPHTIFWNQ